MTIQSFAQVYNDDRVSEVVIVDDASSEESYNRLKSITNTMSKVKLFRNETNIDCYRNKAAAIGKATNEFVAIIDSDNEISTEYLDNIYLYEWRKDIILQPSFAAPHFNFTPFSSLYVTKKNVAENIDKHRMFTTMLNAMNYFVNRDEFLRVWKGDVNPHTADSIYQALNWLEEGNQIYVVPGLTYLHRVHDGSHYQNNKHKTGNFYNEVEQKIRQLL